MGGFLELKSANSLTRAGLIATLDTSPSVHDLVVGQGVFITGAFVSGNPNNSFNGTFSVKSVTSTSFSYEMKDIPAADADSSPKPQFAGAAQVSNWLIENNIIELGPSRPGYWGQPTGILMTVMSAQLLADLPYVFRQVVIRGNVIRQLDYTADIYHFGIIVY